MKIDKILAAALLALLLSASGGRADVDPPSNVGFSLGITCPLGQPVGTDSKGYPVCVEKVSEAELATRSETANKSETMFTTTQRRGAGINDVPAWYCPTGYSYVTHYNVSSYATGTR